MRVLDWSALERRAEREEGRWRYGLLVEEIEAEGFHCESYGFLAADPRTGEERRCRHVTVNARDALELLGKLIRCGVSPTQLPEVIEDWLGR